MASVSKKIKSWIFKFLSKKQNDLEINNTINTISLDSSTISTKKVTFDKINEKYWEYEKKEEIDPGVKLIAFYLPQFHPFAENDKWWGKGFTEWTNVGKAKPLYSGHYQPHCPIHLGYYDLRIIENMEEQSRLAKQYGIYGFNYYFYWFNGKTLMEEPLKMMLSNSNIRMPFCLTWANENWTRTWDGLDNEVLIKQEHNIEDAERFIEYISKYFNDGRYIRIDNKPVLIVYRVNIIPNIKDVVIKWREKVTKLGFEGLYLVSAQTFGITSPEPFGFDASMEFPPHGVESSDIKNQKTDLDTKFTGHIFDYEQVVKNETKKHEPDYKLFRSVMLSWDNSARKSHKGHIFDNFSLLKYKQWLEHVCFKTHNNIKYGNDEKFVFINAWNEWAEGTHLEPDQKYGYGYLEATYDAIRKFDKKNTYNYKTLDRVNSNIAVFLHIYYDEIWSEVASYIDNISDQDFDLYITTTNTVIIPQILKKYPFANIQIVENRGRDILPFIQTLKKIKNIKYKLVCKIHTKKSIYRNDGDKIRTSIYNSLLGSPQKIKKIIEASETKKDIGLFIPKNSCIKHSETNMFSNWHWTNYICNEFGIKFEYSDFPAGSMFWFKPEALLPLTKIQESLFEIEEGLVDSTISHSIERIFSVITRKNGFNTELLD